MSGNRPQREHEFEPQYGLPELLPAGERILWQGAPDWRALAIEVFHIRKLAIYFLLMIGFRAVNVLGDGGTATAALQSAALLTPIFGVALLLLAGLAWLTATTTAYTITNQRVVMRVGIVLSLTYNLPFKCIEGADLRLSKRGVGDLPIQLARGDRIAYLHLWPHARPWHLQHPQPSLRCVQDVTSVAQVFSQAWADFRRVEVPQVALANSPIVSRAAALASQRIPSGRPSPATAGQ